MSKTVRVLNLGAGVQSTTIYLMMIDGVLPTCDFAVFADTGEEPKAVYEHLKYLQSLGGPRIDITENGRLGDDLQNGTDSGRFASIPAYTNADHGIGINRRQCTSEYKIIPIERHIRQTLNVPRYHRIPKDIEIVQIFGLSFDEPKRVDRVKTRYQVRPQWEAEFPLFDEFMTRKHCIKWLQKRLPDKEVPRSACVFCPYRSDTEWVHLKESDPAGWDRAVEIDEAIRKNTSACTRGLESNQYIHRSCVPLPEVKFKPKTESGQKAFDFTDMDCEGMCGV